MAFPALKEIAVALCDGFAAESTEPMASCAVRYGPQHSFTLATGEVGLIVVRLSEMEPSALAHSGNAWTEWPRFRVSVFVKEDPAVGGTTLEDRRLDLIDQVLAWLQSNRTIVANATGAHAVVVKPDEESKECGGAQLFRTAAIEVRVHRIRS